MKQMNKGGRGNLPFVFLYPLLFRVFPVISGIVDFIPRSFAKIGRLLAPQTPHLKRLMRVYKSLSG